MIVRSDIGKKLLDETEFARADVNRDDIVKLVILKRKNAEKNFARIVEGLAVEA